MLGLNFALAFYMLGNVADVITTNRVLSAGGRELNPVMAKIMDVFGRSWHVVKLGLALALGLVLHHYEFLITLWVLGVVFWGAAIHNHRAGNS